MSNKKQTAVEILIEKLHQIRDTIGMNTKQNRYARGRVVDCIIEAKEALQLEREQIEEAWNGGILSTEEGGKSFDQTYGKP
jgi:hypothetical protein